MAVPTGSVVEHFDVVEDIGLREVSRSVNAFLDALRLCAANHFMRAGMMA
jgi:hypothetical protein